MRNEKDAFRRILLIELDDLKDDIELLLKRYTELHDSDVISNYVFFENTALVRNELFGLEGYKKEVEQLDTSDFAGVDDIRDYLADRIAHRCREKGIAEGLCHLVIRKLDKVRGYVERNQRIARQ
ncbi:MAG: hypothetical protein GF344_10945 [Chitinivibrionales bacterium]|nr:hypothetical protein [Chitinivibrionales bacterium]MBD3357320.1 hypothetical protein [Chitinivibrionales bacterium]